MPKHIQNNDFIRSVIILTIIMEALGAICLPLVFINDGMGLLQAIWYGIFHSISAFCTAGFALFNNSFESYHDHAFVNMALTVLAIAGSLGFIVITDHWYRFTGKSKNHLFYLKNHCIWILDSTYDRYTCYLSDRTNDEQDRSSPHVNFFLSDHGCYDNSRF